MKTTITNALSLLNLLNVGLDRLFIVAYVLLTVWQRNKSRGLDLV